jgi:hypothetical protein
MILNLADQADHDAKPVKKHAPAVKNNSSMKCKKDSDSGRRSGLARQRQESLARYATVITTAFTTWLASGFFLGWSALAWLLSGLVAVAITLALSGGMWVFRQYWA